MRLGNVYVNTCLFQRDDIKTFPDNCIHFVGFMLIIGSEDEFHNDKIKVKDQIAKMRRRQTHSLLFNKASLLHCSSDGVNKNVALAKGWIWKCGKLTGNP